ncbi:hypothetical protein [Yinghuangia seranimata]|uniref:hypothetical protein n=1 Tax=Yinghuangia seranimata TaxID=408067 RepID=UPI00248C7B7B|nr:hypothetical protein [Yinghuangia seranimata]MDI2131123.1 hypothetical protein [Yinghuangia seranimata]
MSNISCSAQTSGDERGEPPAESETTNVAVIGGGPAEPARGAGTPPDARQLRAIPSIALCGPTTETRQDVVRPPCRAP